jgi:hypothetical protein
MKRCWKAILRIVLAVGLVSVLSGCVELVDFLDGFNEGYTAGRNS